MISICYGLNLNGILKSVIYIWVLIFSLLVLYMFFGELYYYIQMRFVMINWKWYIETGHLKSCINFQSSCFIYVFRRIVLLLYIDDICYGFNLNGILKSVIYIVVLIFSLLVLYMFFGELYYCYIQMRFVIVKFELVYLNRPFIQLC